MFDEWDPPRKYELNTVKGIKEILQPLQSAHKSRDCQQAGAAVAWVCVKEQLQQEKRMWLAVLASDLATKLGKQEDEREMIKAVK